MVGKYFARLKSTSSFCMCFIYLTDSLSLGQKINTDPAFMFNPSKLFTSGTQSSTVVCASSDPSKKSDFTVTFGKQVVAKSNYKINNGIPEIDPLYLEKQATAKMISNSSVNAISVTINEVKCSDRGEYHCLVKTGTSEVTRKTFLDVNDRLQRAILMAKPDRKDKNVSEGEPLELTCKQTYGYINPRDPRTKPTQLYWRWEYSTAKTDWTRIAGALSIFQDTETKTGCNGLLLQSILLLYPLQSKHSEATVRCYLIVNMKPVDKSLFASYTLGPVGPPPLERPLSVTYDWTTSALMALLLGLAGFLFSILSTSMYFLNKKYRFCGRASALPKEVLEEEEELEKMETEFNKTLQADNLEASAKAKSSPSKPEKTPVQSEPESSAVEESSVVENTSAAEESSMASEATSAAEK